MRCDIIMPVWNQLDATRDCVSSIAKNTDYPFRLIIIDNGSDTQTAAYLDSLAGEKYLNLTLIRNASNLGFVKAVNQGLKASDGAHICIMNNDTIATAGWLDEMLAVMNADPRIGILNPSSNTSGQFPPEGVSIESFSASLKKLKGQTQELNVARGFCMLLKRQVLDKVGLLDESYSIGYFEETDFSKRAQGAGFALGRAKASYVYHKEGTSFKELKDRQAIFKENEELYFKKWGRCVRAAYLVDSLSSKKKIDDIAMSVARDGHQMLVFIKKGLDWPVTVDHFDIRAQEMGGVYFGLGSFLQILKRRKKKAVEVILTDNPSMGGFLKAASFLHGADVVVNPEKDEVLSILRSRSRQLK